MLNKKHLQNVRKDLLSYAEKRREVIKMSGDAQQHAKKAIFAMQRDDVVGAKERLNSALALLIELNKKYKNDSKAFHEGAYRSAIEEYAEAILFFSSISNTEIGVIKDINIDSDTYVGGLCDVPGELYRYAIRSATKRDFVMVKKCYKIAEEIIGELLDMDLTGYNRTKFDQAKQALHKLEEVVYEVGLSQKVCSRKK